MRLDPRVSLFHFTRTPVNSNLVETLCPLHLLHIRVSPTLVTVNANFNARSTFLFCFYNILHNNDLT